ncbi:LytR/AlgR family response regulator transcription factor [Paenibacillus graminis]|uniref:Stage 0 sporulation protein A homolog n=1 Tax=Paenibacillus graminis TaxID=189425 RepID=A0A089NL15_9BACL|nr:response regulator transcription factor [Paenibacillus graminis]AIQ69739.1 hypothetical protein PGRAT_20485 [Paenibacillus graminis]
MMNIAICDNDYDTHMIFKDFFSRYLIESTVTCFVQYFPSGEELLRYYSIPGHYSFHLVFLDVEMSGINGIETALRIRAMRDYKVQIIFISNNSDHMLESFYVQPYYYQIKPIVYKTFKSLLERAFAFISNVICPIITLKTTDGELRIKPHQIIYLEKTSKTEIEIYTLDNVFYSRLTLNQIIERLDTNFCQIHRSIIVNTKYVHKFTYSTVVLINKKILPLGRSYKKKFDFHVRQDFNYTI